MAESKIRQHIRERRVVHRPKVMEKDPIHNRAENLEKALVALKEALGEEWATDAPSILCGYARDQSPAAACYPHIVCLPSSTQEVQDVYRIANEYLIDVMPYGTGLTTGGLTLTPFGGIICDLRRMDQILEIDGENLFAVIQPGVNYLMLQAAAQQVGCRALNPSTSATAGVISNHAFCNINMMASKYGFGMDNVIDVEMILPNGDIFKTGPESYGAVKGHVQGPGPDMSTMFRYAFGTLGIVTKMTIRLYPEPKHTTWVVPTYDEDKLEVMAEAIQKVAQDNLANELAHMMDSFFGIFFGDDNREASKLAEIMPRHSILAVLGGQTEEEVQCKAEVSERVLSEMFPMFEFLPLEAMIDLMEDNEFLNYEKFSKYFNVTVRVMRVRGSFLIGALIDHFDNMVQTEKLMRAAITDQVGTTDDVFAPDDASTYMQPYHMGRAAYMEFDTYTNQSDKDDLFRIFAGYIRLWLTAVIQGMVPAAGPIALLKGIPMMDLVMPAMQPKIVPLKDAFTLIKMTVDPNNISNRRWEYETQTMKKAILFS